MEEALRKMNLTYKIVGGLSFYQRKEIKDLMAYLTRGGVPAVRAGSSPPPEGGTTAPRNDLGKADLSATITAAQLRRRVLYVPPSMPAVANCSA